MFKHSLHSRSALRFRLMVLATAAAALLLLSGCSTGTRVEIKVVPPNQTAFLIPVAGDISQQSQLQSLEFLKKKQVAYKQVTIPYEWKQTGGNAVVPSGDWYPTARLVLVDRSLVTREWTKSTATGTSTSDQAFGVESSESVDFKVGATCTALIQEEDAAAYLYYYGEKPLSEVMDQNIRGFIQQELFNQFGSMKLEEGQRSKKTIFETVRANLEKNFKPRGITILSFGGSDGMVYTDPNIQAAISANYAAQQRVVQAQALATQQGYENERIVSQANAQATATVIAGAAAAQVMQENGKMLEQYPGLTNYTIAQKSTGQVPQILVLGGNSGNGSLPFSLMIQPQITPTPPAK